MEQIKHLSSAFKGVVIPFHLSSGIGCDILRVSYKNRACQNLWFLTNIVVTIKTIDLQISCYVGV